MKNMFYTSEDGFRCLIRDTTLNLAKLNGRLAVCCLKTLKGSKGGITSTCVAVRHDLARTNSGSVYNQVALRWNIHVRKISEMPRARCFSSINEMNGDSIYRTQLRLDVRVETGMPQRRLFRPMCLITDRWKNVLRSYFS